MYILKNCEKIQIVTKDKEEIFVLYQNRLYETFGSFKCVEPGHEDKYLYTNLRAEYFDNQKEAKQELEKLNNESGNTFANDLQKMMIKVLAESSVDKVMDQAKPLLDNYIRDTYGSLPKRFEVKTPTITKTIDGVTHEKFEDVLNLVNLEIPVYLEGPAGTGKNVICKQVAESLDLEFYFTNAVTQEFKLTGFIDANGKYQETQFYKAFKEGGLFFLDEMDASIPEVLIILNAAIANRYFDFPNGKIEAHPDFRVIAAGNTGGSGATLEYSGRYQLDGASLDRFAMIKIDYSPAIEDAIADGNKELLQFIRDFRKVTNDNGIYCITSYRTISRIMKLEGVLDLSEVLQISLIKTLNKDDVQIIINQMDSSNKYVRALAA